MKAVMYHYVRPSADGLPYFPFLALADFERQLDYFANTFGLVGRPAFENWLGGGTAPEGVLLTFDDGLRDHIEHVLPALRERAAFAIFYVPSGPVATGELLDVHKLHLALGRLGGEAALTWLLAHHPELEGGLTVGGAGHYAVQKADAATSRLKRLYNWELDAEQRRSSLDGLLAHAFGGAPPGWESFYLTEEDMTSLLAAGMGVGAHGHRHAILSHLDEAEQRREITASCDMVASMTGGLQWGYCYAHGIAEAFDERARRAVAATGCPFAFAVADEDITTPLMAADPFALPRHNCNGFAHGAATFGNGTAKAVWLETHA